jgi:hypothetical protein
MIEIRNVYPPAITQLDRAPKPASRAEARDVPSSKVRAKVATPDRDRRNNPDRRQRRGKERLDQRTGADRRRNALDIKV